MAHSQKSSVHQMRSNLAKTSSIFDVYQQKSARPLPVGHSTTSFTYEPSQADEKLVAQRRAVFEPTYRLEPCVRFKPQAVTDIINQALHEYLNEKEYDASMAGEQSKAVAAEIQHQVKKLKFDRYKYVVSVTIGQKTGQSVDISSRCIWDKDNDSMASGFYKSATMFAVGIVFGCFFE